MQSFDFVVAVNTLVDAWEGVKPELIQTCFHTAGFMTYVPPPPEPLPEPPRNLWERMQNIFDVNCTFGEYVTADDHAESSQPMTDEDIINAVRNHDSPSADSESSTPEGPDLISNDDLDVESNDDGVAANESEIIHTSNQFLRILDQMKAYALRNQLSREALTISAVYLCKAKLEQLVYKLTYQLTLIRQSDELQSHLCADACI